MKYLSSVSFCLISSLQKYFRFSPGLKAAVTAILLLMCIPGLCQKTSVYFKFNDYLLDAKAKNTIDSLIQNNSIQKIILQGHCDSVGSNSYNDVLSNKRVTEVRRHIVANNIPENAIEIKALGKRLLINKNETEKERALNRRVEIELIVKAVQQPLPDTLKPEMTKPININEVEVVISGIVLSENKKPLIAEISLNDKNGNEIQTTVSDKDGKYKLKAVLNKKDDYALTYYNDSSFVGAKKINISNARLPYKNLRTILPKLKGGGKYILENLNFESDTSQLVTASLPSLEALYKLMKKNKSLIIRIEGHVNYPSYYPNPKKPKVSNRYVPPGMNNNEFCQWLSEERAKMVYNYLVEKGIKDKRISTIGYGASKMLFPDTHSEAEMAQNRRVEINVISAKNQIEK